MRKIFILILMLASILAYGQEKRWTVSEPSYQEEPTLLPKGGLKSHIHVLEYTNFTVGFDLSYVQPIWVYCQLTGVEATQDMPRKNDFRPDPAVRSATLQDYKASGFDRGHMSPAADNSMSQKANSESFLMSNMSPQLPGFNRGIWVELERWVRQQAIKYDTIYIVTGPVFVNNLGTVGENEVTIPGYYYKCLLRFENGKPKAIAFLLPHIGSIGNIKNYIVPVNAVETMTGLDFFNGLDDKTEEVVEGDIKQSNWDFSKMSENKSQYFDTGN